MTKLANTSACCCASAPAIVIGPEAPRIGAGSEWKQMPASATARMADVTLSVKVSGLTGETAMIRLGPLRNASRPPAQAAAISTE